MQSFRFKLNHLFALSLLISTLCNRPAQAMGLTFDIPLQPASTPAPVKHPSHTSHPDAIAALPHSQPLTIPIAASQPPVNPSQIPQASPLARLLPPPPPRAVPTSHVFPPVADQHPQPAPNQDQVDVGLSFTPTHIPAAMATAAMPLKLAIPQWIYEGGSGSLVARVIGSAEGTRTASGLPTQAYYGHTDPGNGVWNMGTFSYQHGAQSPQEADQKQLRRLQGQGQEIEQQAQQAGLAMTLNEILNGLDLANQAPKAALDKGGYIDRLAEAKAQGMEHTEAIVWARTYAYIDPKTQRWNAPGLGNTQASIQRDQHRRHDAIYQAFDQYQAQQGLVAELPELPPQAMSSHALEVDEPLPQKGMTAPTASPPQTITAVDFNVATLTPIGLRSARSISTTTANPTESSLTPSIVSSHGNDTQTTKSQTMSQPQNLASNS